jgi:hypothetical protein
VENEKITFSKLLGEIPMIARFILIGLSFISILVIYDFFRLVALPGPLVPGEDLYIHIAMLILVPFSLCCMLMASFGYAYYQKCKLLNIKPFWDNFMKEING